jgi:hypothetical protein
MGAVAPIKTATTNRPYENVALMFYKCILIATIPQLPFTRYIMTQHYTAGL